MFVGIDLGTSALKAVLVDGAQQVLGSSTRPLRVSTPHAGWSEQAPQDWWAALMGAMDALAAAHPREMAGVTGIGLSGQQHGAVLLDSMARCCDRAYYGMTNARRGNARSSSTGSPAADRSAAPSPCPASPRPS